MVVTLYDGMPPQTPAKTPASTVRNGPTPQRPPAHAVKPAADGATEPLPLPGMSIKARLMIVGAVLLVGAMVAVAVFAILTSQPPPDPLVASQTALDDALQNLRGSNWRNLQGVSRDDLERRLLLLDASIYATDGFSNAVSRLDRGDPENARAYARRDAAVARGKVLRMGRRMIAFLRDQFGHWTVHPVKGVLWDQPALAEQFVVLQTELDDGMAQLKAASQPVLPPGPPVRNDLLEEDEDELAPPQTKPTASPPAQ